MKDFEGSDIYQKSLGYTGWRDALDHQVEIFSQRPNLVKMLTVEDLADRMAEAAVIELQEAEKAQFLPDTTPKGNLRWPMPRVSKHIKYVALMIGSEATVLGIGLAGKALGADPLHVAGVAGLAAVPLLATIIRKGIQYYHVRPNTQPLPQLQSGIA